MKVIGRAESGTEVEKTYGTGFGAAIYMVKETLIKYLYRHAGEYQHPVNNCFDLILAYARMTTK